MENYLTDDAVKAVKSDRYRALASFEALSEVDPAWGKNENWQIAAEMSKDDLAATDIGEFLERLAEQIGAPEGHLRPGSGRL